MMIFFVSLPLCLKRSLEHNSATRYRKDCLLSSFYNELHYNDLMTDVGLTSGLCESQERKGAFLRYSCSQVFIFLAV